MDLLSPILNAFSGLANQETMLYLVRLFGIIGWSLFAVAAAIWIIHTLRRKRQISPPALRKVSVPDEEKDSLKKADLTPEPEPEPDLERQRFAQFLSGRDADLEKKVAALKAADLQARTILEKERALIRAKLADLDGALAGQKSDLLTVARALDDFREDFYPEQLEKASGELARGETGAAEFLLRQVLAEGTLRAAEASYYLGILAENRIDYLWALQYFYYAAQLEPDNPTYLSAAGEVAYALGHYQEAENLIKSVLKIRSQLLGSEHPEVAQILNNLGVICHTQGKSEMAEALYQWALEIDQSSLGPDHPKVAIYLENFAALLQEQGRVAEAGLMEARVRAIREKQEHLEAEKTKAAGAAPADAGIAADADEVTEIPETVSEVRPRRQKK
jgi:tetratricopeptide (TPR) repeat protein